MRYVFLFILVLTACGKETSTSKFDNTLWVNNSSKSTLAFFSDGSSRTGRVTQVGAVGATSGIVCDVYFTWSENAAASTIDSQETSSTGSETCKSFYGGSKSCQYVLDAGGLAITCNGVTVTYQQSR